MYIVIVEDCDIVRGALVQFLGKFQSVRTESFDNAIDAIDCIHECSPDVLITDWDLGRSDSGIAIARALRTQDSVARIIFISGKSIQQLKAKTAQLGVQHYLEKPFSLSELKQAVFS